MASTPAKSPRNNYAETLTPVRFLDSPRVKTSSSDANIVACKARLEVIIKLQQNNYAKWQLAQKRGVSLCTSIEAIKTRALEPTQPTTSATHTTAQEVTKTAESTTLYPKELRPYCDKLAAIVSIYQDIIKSTRESVRQLRALCKLPGAADEIFYRTWPLIEFVTWLEQILICYEQEVQVKVHVARELAHCTSRAELIRCATAWEYPQHVDDWVALMFAFLAEEVNLSKK